MKYTKRQKTQDLYSRADRMGFTYSETEILRRAQITLHTWSEHECNGYIQRDEKTDQPHTYNTHTGKRIARTPDRERGALARIAAVMAAHPHLASYHQGDPRGCQLYILARDKIPAGESIAGYYAQGFAVCVD